MGGEAGMEIPKKLRRTVGKMARQGEEPLLIVPALVERLCNQRMLAMARIGMGEAKIFSWLVITEKHLHIVWPGLLWDKVQTVPLEEIKDIEYVKEFHNNSLKLIFEKGAESIIFYDDADGIRFYQFIKYKRWKDR